MLHHIYTCSTVNTVTIIPIGKRLRPPYKRSEFIDIKNASWMPFIFWVFNNPAADSDSQRTPAYLGFFFFFPRVGRQQRRKLCLWVFCPVPSIDSRRYSTCWRTVKLNASLRTYTQALLVVCIAFCSLSSKKKRGTGYGAQNVTINNWPYTIRDTASTDPQVRELVLL